MKKILLFLLLATLIISIGGNFVVFQLIRPVKADDAPVFFEDEIVNKSKAVRLEDADKDKIFDQLEQELERKGDAEKTNVIVLLKKSSEEVDEEILDLKKSLGEFSVSDTYEVVSGFAGVLTKKQILQLSQDVETLQIEADVEVQAHLNTATQWSGIQKARSDFGVDGNADGNPATYSKDDVVIAVIDTGIDIRHKDLDQGKVIGWKDFINNKTAPYDDNGHGTHVSSIAAGEGEANPSLAGVGSRAALVGVKVLNSSGSGTLSGVISGVNWVVTNKAVLGVEIINLSLGTNGCSDGTDSLSQAVNNAVAQGIVVTVSAGNSGPGTCTIGSPGAASGAITVGAMADVGERGFYLASFSSRGPTLDGRIKPDVVAPGVAINAARRGTTTGYRTLSGTSMSSPFIAGTVALMLDKNPTLTPAAVKSILASTAVDWTSVGFDIDTGAGRLDGYEAVRNSSSPASSGTNIIVPAHTFISDNLPGTGAVDNWNINVVNAAYPVAITLIMPTWTSGSSPDFDLWFFDPTGSLIASSLGITRQETIAVSISATGTYTVQVDSFSGSGPYYLDISAGSAPLAPDTTPPTVSITDPLNGATVSGTITISATASDNVGVTSVDFFVDVTLIGTDTAAPYNVSWNSATVTNGTHTITATARDAASNNASNTISVMVNNDTQPPTVPTSLSATAISSSQIDLSWNPSTDNLGVTGYRVYRDNVVVATVAATTYSDTNLSASTTYSYQVSALDAAGNESLKSDPLTATTLPPPPSNLSVSVSASSTVPQGDTFRVRATITNTGSSSATGVQTTIFLPAGLSTENSLIKTVGDIVAGDSETVSWRVRADNEGSYIIIVQVSDSSGTTSQGSASITVVAGSGSDSD